MSRSGDVTEIQQVILGERQGRDRGWWEQMRAAYAPDSTVALSWFTGSGPDFVPASQGMSEHGDRAVHRLSPPVVHVDGDRAIAEVSCAVEFQVRVEGVRAHLISYTRLNYRLLKRDGGWRVHRMDAIYERDTLTPALPADTLAVGGAQIEGYRDSYALLAFHLGSQGYSIRSDLLGDDRPDEVEAFYAGLRSWLRTG